METKQERQERYKTMYESMTLQEIGDKEGISAERVRQIIEGSNTDEVREQLINDYAEALVKMTEEELLEECERLSKPDREKETVDQRKLLVNFLKMEKSYSTNKISELIKRDYSTILNMFV